MDRAGWVLTGGKSSRMGFDKALIADRQGRPMAARIAGEVAKVCGGSVSLVGNPERYAELGLPVIADDFPGCGPLAGIEAALRTSRAEWNLVVACDMPALGDAIFEELFAAGGDCALPRYEDGRVEPLCAVYHRRCGPAIRESLLKGVRKVTDALAGLELRYVRVANGDVFVNLNTPEDLERYGHG